RSKGRPRLPEKGLGRLAQWAQAGRPSPFSRRLASSFLPKSFGVYTFHDCTPLDIVIFEISSSEKDRTENPFLNLILWALSFGLHWRVDVHERASSHHGLWSFVWALAFVFLRVTARSLQKKKYLQ